MRSGILEQFNSHNMTDRLRFCTNPFVLVSVCLNSRSKSQRSQTKSDSLLNTRTAHLHYCSTAKTITVCASHSFPQQHLMFT